MSELDNAMEEQMAYLVIHESQPFCYRDFLWWDDGEKEWGMQHNTFRNKISKLRKASKAKFCYYSSCAFYTLEGYPFVKPVTPYPYGGLPLFSNLNINKNDPLYKTLRNLPFGAESIHDIRLRFQVPDIYKILSNPNNFPFLSKRFNLARNSNSGDIAIPSWAKDNAIVRIIIHKTDVVSVIIGCSKQPIPLDIAGLIRFSSLLTRAEDRLQSILDYQNQYYNYIDTAGSDSEAPAVYTTAAAAPAMYTTAAPERPPGPAVVVPIKIPEYESWIITMWHFGRDALVEYNGEKFSRTIEDAQHILTRIYSKEYGNGKGRRRSMRIRQETQEYPNKTVFEAIEEELSLSSSIGSESSSKAEPESEEREREFP